MKSGPTAPARWSRFHQLTKRAPDNSITVLERNQGGRGVSGTHSKRKNRKRKAAAAARRRNRP